MSEPIRTVVHELGNVLNPLKLQIALLRRRVTADPRVHEIIDGLEETVQRGLEALERLRSAGE